jgi:molybdopterin-guanine dinucleotide biosynthesis protein A
MNQLTAVVFCGGASTRMGQDKGLIKTETGNWAQSGATLLTSLKLPVYISIRQQQLAVYNAIFPVEQLVTDDTAMPVGGPLRGLLSIHKKFPVNDLLILACDMQKVNKALVSKLLAAYHTKKGFDAYLFSQGQEPEPLFAIYCQQALEAIYAAAISGQLQKHSMKFMLSQLRPYYLPITKDILYCFSNINSPDELTSF